MRWIYRHPALYDVVDTICSLSFSDHVRRKVFGRLCVDSFLEIGAGSGKNFAVANSGFKIGLERSLSMLRHAKRRFPAIVAVIGDAHHLPFRDACVSVSVFSYCLRGLPRPVDAVREALRVSSEVIIVDYDKPRAIPRVVWEKVIDRFGWTVFGSRDLDYGAVEHLSDSCRANALYGGLYKVLVLKGTADAQS